MEEHTRGFVDLGGRIDGLSARINALDQKVDRFREELDARIDARIDSVSARIDVLDQRIPRQFVWLVGIQIAVLLAVIGVLLGR